jgi:ethanolamine utilization microcompartment shell protein EutL
MKAQFLLGFVLTSTAVIASTYAAAAETPRLDVLAYYQPTPDSINWNIALVSGTTFNLGSTCEISRVIPGPRRPT